MDNKNAIPGQPAEAHLRIAHTIEEQIIVGHFSEQERRILWFVLRLSWGYSFNKDFDRWAVGHTPGYLPRKFSEIVSLNLRTSDPPQDGAGLRAPEVRTYGIRKSSTPASASAKEIVNKYINNGIGSDPLVSALEENLAEAADLWNSVLAMLRTQVNAANYATWLNNTRALHVIDYVLTLKVPNTFVAHYLDTTLRSLIEKICIDVTHLNYTLVFVTEPQNV